MMNVKASSVPAEETGSVRSRLPSLSLSVPLGEEMGQNTKQNKTAASLVNL